jgi:hypothetical protein
MMRNTVALCCNMDGSDKIEATIIGKSMQLKCFKNADILSLNCRYSANNKAIVKYFLIG